MRLVHVAAACLNQTPLDWDGNRANIVAALRAARGRAVDIVCFPELCITGYGCEDAFHSPAVAAMALTVLDEVLPETRGIVAAIGLPLLYNNGLFNVVALCVDGKIAGFVAKQNLAGEGLHYEPRWFKAWPAGVRTTVELDDVDVPLGDLLFELDGVRLGFEICEDAWVASRPGAELSRRGVDVILNPSASHFAFGKFAVRKGFVAEGARAFGVTYVYTNLSGNESGRAIYDGGALIATAGELVAQGERFSFEPWTLTTAVVDVDRTRRIQAGTASFRPHIGTGGAEVEADFHFGRHTPAVDPLPPASWEVGDSLREEEFARSIALALFDYLRKSRARGYVVSLSGGADSTAVSCLVALMVELGCAQLGLEPFRQRLSHIGLSGTSTRALVGELLTCAYQATANSGEVTRASARGVADAIGATFHELDVSAIVDAYVALAAGALGRELTWERDDLALQNIQARVRGPSVWMLANIKGALLLATSNRSEASVGYATMDGDTCGGLSPVAGINKAYLLRWLAWLEARPTPIEPLDIGPLPALHLVTAQRPTAELRPAAAEQTDEGDLMPYVVLDAIERAAIRDKQSPSEVLEVVAARFSELDRGQLAGYVERFFTLWCRNQWKRERFAPAFHVDDENVDPKTWCRFPILSGGYARELRDLREQEP
ncbi:MAG: NAD(+) synthase [Myxococcales bacterium]|nr:NAD(+) synthase [Myxococcales bacterium]